VAAGGNDDETSVMASSTLPELLETIYFYLLYFLIYFYSLRSVV